jgi:hypothetical protein
LIDNNGKPLALRSLAYAALGDARKLVSIRTIRILGVVVKDKEDGDIAAVLGRGKCVLGRFLGVAGGGVAALPGAGPAELKVVVGDIVCLVNTV